MNTPQVCRWSCKCSDRAELIVTGAEKNPSDTPSGLEQTDGMATDFTQDSVLYFLRCNGGRVKNSELLAHFNAFIKDHKNQTHNRELFKKFINSVAVVKTEEGVRYVVLRKTFLGHVVGGDITAGSHSPTPPIGQQPAPQARERDRSPRDPVNLNQERGQKELIETHLNVTNQKLHVPPGNTIQLTEKILASAGIVKTNNVKSTVNFEKPIQSSSPCVTDHALPPASSNKEARFRPSYNAEKSKGSEDGSGQNIEAKWDKKPVTLPLSVPKLNHKGIYIGGYTLGKQSIEPKRSYPPPEFLYTEVKPPAPQPHLAQVQQNAVQPKRKTSEADHRGASAATGWPLLTTLEHASSFPCLSDPSAAPLTPDPQVTRSNCNLDGNLHLHHSIPQQPRPKEDGVPDPVPIPDIHSQYPEESRAAVPQSWVKPQPPQCHLPLDSPYHTPTADSARSSGYSEQYHHQADSGLSSHHSHSSLLLCPSLNSRDEWPQGSRRDEWASYEALNYQVLSGEQLSQMHCAEKQAPCPHYHSTGYLDNNKVDIASSWHHSTGYLHDDDGSESNESTSIPGSAPEPFLRPAVQRLSTQLRSRMCRSLGAGLDQQFPEDGVSARHNRLHLLSSNLSISHSFSHPTSRTPSYRDLRGEMRSGASSNKSLNSGHDSSYFHRHNLVPLEPKEHDWLVKGAAGLWADIYTLFRDEPSLLTKRDFITGYTILHWIAKHGDHRVLNTLWYGVNKAGFKLDVDVKTTCGYTPLHLATIHGNDKMIRLLVHKFSANVALRDTSGKKAWQHLSRTGPIDLLEMLGAPQCLTSTEGSSSSQSTGERPTRPVTSSGSAAVKRSTSIAVFLNKTLMKFPGRERSQSSDSLV
ncbi:ankyrin repeat domain-containing protein SOWAHB [Oncorhynchus kisutch]|uniref:ankyrin repeat domain-containing protein SOWAHB n=1 Tax=Oncorhynchus kisutch TaxID=8019 RepID=UPI0012DD5047|nr:ankyrin repeat domain-containing protein SOWAHB [Oncorhynchus kisutch]